MPQFDQNKIATLISEFRKSVQRLKSLATLTEKDFLKDPDKIFQSLAEAGALDEGFALELRNMAKFRNRLVHLYWEVNDNKLYEILQSRIGDFKKFLNSMATFLKFDEM